MSSGCDFGTVYVHARKGAANYGPREGGTSVGWVVCDHPACKSSVVLPDCGDASRACDEAEEGGWSIGHNGTEKDYCPDHKAEHEADDDEQ